MPSISELRWKCRRGMKELDLLFDDYLVNHYPNASPAQKKAFEELIHEQDPIISDYLFERTESPDPETKAVIDIMREFVR